MDEDEDEAGEWDANFVHPRYCTLWVCSGIFLFQEGERWGRNRVGCVTRVKCAFYVQNRPLSLRAPLTSAPATASS